MERGNQPNFNQYPPEEIGHTYTNVSYDGRSVNMETDPRSNNRNFEQPQKRAHAHRPPDGIDMGQKRRGGMITQEELKRRIEMQQKEQQQMQQQMQFHQQQFNQRQQQQQQFNMQPQQQQKARNPYPAVSLSGQRPMAPQSVAQPIKAESPLQSIFHLGSVNLLST